MSMAVRLGTAERTMLPTPSPPQLLEEGCEKSEPHAAVFVAVGLLLGLDDGRELEDVDPGLPQLKSDRLAHETLVGEPVADRGEHVQRAELGLQEMCPQGRQLLRVRFNE